MFFVCPRINFCYLDRKGKGMVYILLALALFMASVTAHLIFCRKTTKSGLHAKAFIGTAIFFGGLDALLAYLLQHAGIVDPDSWWGQPFKITAGVVYILLIPI